MKIICKTFHDTQDLGFSIAKKLKPNDCVCLNGDLGAGKTQFVKGAAKQLGIKEEIISPTFNILLEYTSSKLALFHFDLYRLNYPEELNDIAFYEKLESGGISFIEWSQKFPECMPDDSIEIEFSVSPDNSRIISFPEF